MNDRLRYTRQTRLPEIGETGQARLAAATVSARTEGFARSIETAYLRAAGVGRIEEDDTGEVVEVAALGIRDPAAREVAEGALAALVTMRKVLAS